MPRDEALVSRELTWAWQNRVGRDAVIRSAPMVPGWTPVRRRVLGVGCVCATLTPVPVASGDGVPSAWTPPAHRVTVVDGEFVESATGTPFIPRGVNIVRLVGGDLSFFSPGVFDRAGVDAAFAGLADRGYNTARLFVDACSFGPECLTNATDAGLSGEFLDAVTEVLALAKEHGLVLLLTANDLPDGGGYRELSSRDDSVVFPGYRNSDFLTASGHDAMVAFWSDLLVGLVARRADLDVVLGWSILNEHWLFMGQPPLTLTTGTVTTATGTYDLADVNARRAMIVDGTRRLIAATAAGIRAHDPGALVTMGFFAPQFPNPTTIGGDWYTDTAPLVVDSDLDFFDFHAYPAGDLGVEQIAENFGVTDAKPVVMGEVGAFVDRFSTVEQAGVVLQEWIARSCTAGFDGWLYWAYERLPADDATWGLVDAGGYLLDGLSPAHQPDPCVPTLLDGNVVGGRPARASQTLGGSSPSLAVDGLAETSWVAGTDAPQWIEIELDGPTTITGVALTVDQDPTGATVHAIEVVDSAGDRTEVHRFEQVTAFADRLETTFSEPIAAVTAVRVTTLVSPSWVAWGEIEVFG